MKQRPNVLFLTVDCFRFNRTSWAGYSPNITPCLEKLINEEAMNFTQVIAAGPNTLAAFPALFTSSHPVMYGGTSFISEERTSLPELLKKLGYSTYGLSSNPYITPEFGYDRGFDSFWDSAQRTGTHDNKKDLFSKIIPRNSKLWSFLRNLARRKEIGSKSSSYPSARIMNGKILDVISQNRTDEPFFVWAHYMDLHYPYNLNEIKLTDILGFQPTNSTLADVLTKLMSNKVNILERHDIEIVDGIYNSSLIYLDRQLGNLFKALRNLNKWNDTLVVIVADHGEELCENGSFGHGFSGSESRFSENLIHIPLILKMPGKQAKGRTINALVSQIDVPATILSIAGGSRPENWYGKSAIPLISKKQSMIRNEAITQQGVRGTFAMSWRTEKWKFTFNAFTKQKQLFMLIPEKLSEKDMTDHYPKIEEEIYCQVLEHLSNNEKEYSSERLDGVDLDEGIKKQLFGLGYMD